MKLSGKCGRCGALLYVDAEIQRDVEGSIHEQAQTSCPSCGEKLQVSVRGLPDRRKPDKPGPLEEALAVSGIPPHIEPQTQPVLGVRQPVRPLVRDEVAIPAGDAQTGQVADFDKGEPPEEAR